uniref:Uncharacterized protein n=1 Tax=Moniliophthora roreri TaxID=221103 RepID=A0A0W0G950_MONRR
MQLHVLTFELSEYMGQTVWCWEAGINKFVPLSNTTHETGSLDGREWEYSDAMRVVAELSPQLPHLKEALVAFFEGAAVGWEKFSAEYDEGGDIDKATDEQHTISWMPATNDCNEGTLGAVVVDFHDKPTKTLH